MEDDDTKVDMDQLFSDPEYREYDRMLHGPYIAALMSRADVRRRGGAVRGRAADAAVRATTLSDEVRAAFAESQANLAWTPVMHKDTDDTDVVAAGSRRDDAREMEDNLVADELQDDAQTLEKDHEDFAIPEPHEDKRAPVDDDFDVVRDDDFGTAPDDDFEVREVAD